MIQEWGEACTYAKECLPPIAYDMMREPFSFIITVTIVCFTVYIINEKRLV